MAREFRGRERMLLCVDESYTVLRYERSLFEKSGFIVVTASCGQEAVRFAMLFNFDVVLLDSQIADMDGHEVVVALRLLRPETLVVMFSGREIPAETYNLVDAVVPRTGSLTELVPTVARLCGLVSPD